ncbi:hypothetical protein, partial [Escherichia coli]|uniref:hypothetical protein n=1 Tax=Escherichia coli TaxID=562 RepID=UPI00234DFF38
SALRAKRMDMYSLDKIMMMMLSILSKTARSNGFLDEIIACCRGDVTAANKTNPVSLLLDWPPESPYKQYHLNK